MLKVVFYFIFSDEGLIWCEVFLKCSCGPNIPLNLAVYIIYIPTKGKGAHQTKQRTKHIFFQDNDDDDDGLENGYAY